MDNVLYQAYYPLRRRLSCNKEEDSTGVNPLCTSITMNSCRRNNASDHVTTNFLLGDLLTIRWHMRQKRSPRTDLVMVHSVDSC